MIEGADKALQIGIANGSAVFLRNFTLQEMNLLSGVINEYAINSLVVVLIAYRVVSFDVA